MGRNKAGSPARGGFGRVTFSLRRRELKKEKRRRRSRVWRERRQVTGARLVKKKLREDGKNTRSTEV